MGEIRKDAGKLVPTKDVPTQRHGFKSTGRQRLLSKFFMDDLKLDELDYIELEGVLKSRTKYDEKLGPALVEHMGGGLSYNSFAGLLGVAVSTLRNWESNEGWIEWKGRAVAAGLLFWEQVLKDGSTGVLKVEAKSMIFKLKNMFPDEYKEKIEVENTTPTTIIIEGLDNVFDEVDAIEVESKELIDEAEIVEGVKIEFNDELNEV